MIVRVSAAPVDLAVQGRANTTPSIAADAETVVIAWGATVPGGATDVYAAVSRDGGRTFASPVRVNDSAGDARLSGEQPPRVAVDRDAVTIVWTTKGAARHGAEAGAIHGRRAFICARHARAWRRRAG